MSEGIIVTSKTQIIIVEPASGAVSVISSGPAGPAGPAGPPGSGGGGNTNPIQFLGANETEVLLQLDLSSGDINSELRLKADDLSTGNPAMAYFAGRQFDTTPQYNGAVMGLYNGDGLNGIFAHAFPPENQLNIGVGVGQTASVFIIYDHDANNKLVEITPTGAIDLKEQSVPANPATDVARLYSKDVSGVTKLAMKDSAGIETVFGSGGGGGSSLPITDSVLLSGGTTTNVSIKKPTDIGGYGEWLFDFTGSANLNRHAMLRFLDDESYAPAAPSPSIRLQYEDDSNYDNAQVAAGGSPGQPSVSIRANEGTGSATLDAYFFSRVTSGVGQCGFVMNSVASQGGPVIQLGRVGNSPWIPAAPGAQSAQIYARLVPPGAAGAKMQLVAQFPTGAIQVIATEP